MLLSVICYLPNSRWAITVLKFLQPDADWRHSPLHEASRKLSRSEFIKCPAAASEKERCEFIYWTKVQCGWIICEFTSHSTVFQLNKVDGGVVMKRCSLWNLVNGWKDFRLKRCSNLGPLSLRPELNQLSYVELLWTKVETLHEMYLQ